MSALRARYEHKGPGKYEGEPSWVPYFHEEGFPSEEASYPEGGGWYGLWDVEAKDRRIWPELKKVVGVILYERSDGFVEGTTYSSEKALREAWAEIEADTSEGEEDFG